MSNSLPLNDLIDTSATKYYRIGGLQPTEMYNISLTNVSTNVNLSVYANEFLVVNCESKREDTRDDACISMTNQQGQLFIRVNNIIKTIR